jgi:sugar/nucleoside kinase (ribokinase family)
LLLDRIDRRVDVVLLNFISGHDVLLPELKSFRQKYRGIIYCDYHSLALGHDKNLRRYYRLHPRWRDYAGMADFLQMNLAELASIYHRPLIDKTAIARACRNLHEAGARVVIITMGPDGVMLSESKLSHKGESLTTRIYHIPGMRLRRVIDPTGCGDALGAAFLCHYLRTRDLIKSLELANCHAAATATFSGLDGFSKLSDIVKRLGPPPRAIHLKNLGAPTR